MWDSARTLATSAKLWQKGKAYQQTADFWFGNDSADHYDRIMDMFTRAIQFHDQSFFQGGADPNKAFAEVWCSERGKDGSPRQPEGWEKEGKPWSNHNCENNPNLEGFSYRVVQYFPPIPLDHVWITVWCPSFWNKPRGESLLSLSTVENWVLVNYGGSNRDDLTMTEISRVRGGVALHETFHHSVVATPKIHDAAIIANGDPIKIPNGLPVYGPDLAAGFAKNIGTYRQEPVPPKSGGYNNGEFGTIINADNYVMFALSVHFQELIKRNSPIEPESPRWKDIPPKMWQATPNRTADDLTDSPTLDFYGDRVKAWNDMQSAAAPPPPPPPPAPPVTHEDCHTTWEVASDAFTVTGKNFDPVKFGPADGSNLKRQIGGCLGLTKWKYSGNASSFTASGHLLVGKQSCLARALATAGGSGVCDGTTK